MISIKPKWMAKILMGEKTIEIRKSKGLSNAIQKLIDENGYAEIYMYCTKQKILGKFIKVGSRENIELFGKDTCIGINKGFEKEGDLDLQGKVVAKFRCYKVEEITTQMWTPIIEHEILKKSCLKECELFDYISSHDGTADKPFYTIHISDLKIFDRPKELSEFYKVGHYDDIDDYFTDEKQINGKWCIPLKKAPQNFVYLEVE